MNHQGQNVETQPKRFSKEQEVKKLGIGLQSRIAHVTNVKSLNNKSRKNATSEEYEVPKPSIAERLNPDFLPPNLYKLTSVEVEDILKKAVIYDQRKII